MDTVELQDFDHDLPSQLALSVIMEKKPSTHPWAEFSYQALGVVVSQGDPEAEQKCIYQAGDIEHILISGLSLRLHIDECESYYHNLMSPEPSCFIVASNPDDSSAMPEPYLVSLSFDEAHSYLEGDEQVYSVAIPPELYRWAEAYVLTHYIAIKKKKRKLKNCDEGQS